jgi:hypothetical protein
VHYEKQPDGQRALGFGGDLPLGSVVGIEFDVKTTHAREILSSVTGIPLPESLFNF